MLIVGNGAVGKSSMIQRYCRGSFTKTYKKTIGVDFLEKQLRVHGEDVRLMLWDTAGQEEFDKLRPLAYPKTDVFLVCFCVASLASYNNVKEKWLPEVRAICPDTPIVVVGTQTDRRGKEGISRHHNTMPLSM